MKHTQELQLRSRTDSVGTSQGKERPKWMAFVSSRASIPILAIVAFGILVALGFGYACWRYGSTDAALGALKGKVLLVDSVTKSFGTLRQHELGHVSFRLTNISEQPVRVLGGESDCGCLLFYDSMPLTIAPHSDCAFQVGVRPPEEGNFRGMVTLYTTAPGSRLLALKVIGKVSEVLPGDQ